MHAHDLTPFEHSHSYADPASSQRERALLAVTLLTLVTMVAELLAGWWSGSLALTADGWHMGTHAFALGGAVLAYRLSARASRHAGYAFGGWKIEVLAGYTSALLLVAVAAWLVIDAVRRLLAPHPIAYGEALAVAVLGLAVNLASAWLMSRGGHHEHANPHEHDPTEGHADHHHDHNFDAAYLHVLADALTSLLAIGALAGGWWLGWRWLDPLVALLGAALIARWAWGVLGSSSRALVDATQDPSLTDRIRELIESDGDAKLADLHAWQVGNAAWSVVASVVADRPQPPEVYRARLRPVASLRHITIEVHRCPHDAGRDPRPA